jgi:endonuclease/exonuclease/phosphatase family metal-dependent hydrolase|tara:strand:- start:125 stop:982 length:858 start_codon:yes stop_codon:yes gene_type:complete
VKKYLFIFLVTFLIFFFITSAAFEGNDIHSVITYNIKYDDNSNGENSWNVRKEALLELITAFSPDILGTQEGLMHQVEFLDSKMNDHKYVGVGRDDADRKGEYCAIFFNKKKYKLLKNSTFWLSENPNKVSIGWDAALERICTYALLETIEGGNKIWVFNTHFDHVGNTAREESARLLLEKIKMLNIQEEPVLVMGDFNALEKSKVIDILREGLNDTMRDTDIEHKGPVGTFNNFLNNQEIIKRIDYIFSKGFQTISHQHVDKKLDNGNHISDHLPVFVKVKIMR